MRRSPVALALVVCLAALAGACDEGDFDFTYTFSYTAPFVLDGRFAEASGTTATTDLGTTTFEVAVDVDMLASNPELAAYRDKNKFKKLTIKSVTYTVKNNSADARLPEIQVAIGPKGFSGPQDAEAALIARTAPVDPGETTSGQAILVTDFLGLARTYVFELGYGLGASASLAVNQGDTVPSGTVEVDVEVVLDLKATEI